MTEPDWKDAPEWAQWVAMDEDGEWWWYETEPKARLGAWLAPDGLFREAARPDLVWRDSLRPRPTKEDSSDG